MSPSAFWQTLDAAGLATVELLLSLLWQSSIVLGVAAVLAYALRRTKAAVRQRVWVVALVVTPALPLLTWIAVQVGLPQTPLVVLPAAARYTEGTASPVVVAPLPAGEPAVFPAPKSESIEASQRPAGAVPPMRVDATGASRVVFHPWATALLAYLAIVGTLIGLVVVQMLRIRGWLARGRILTDRPIVREIQAARRHFGLERGCVAVQPAGIEAPMTLRTFHPILVVPKTLEEELSEEELRSIALHEIAHVRRNDPLVLSFASIVRAFLFFHPLVWLAVREIAALAEQAADDAVLQAMGRPLPYAKMLTRLTERLTRRMLSMELAVGIVFSKGQLLRRIEAILSTRGEQRPRLSAVAAGTVILVGALAVGLATTLPLAAVASEGPRSHDEGLTLRRLATFPAFSDLTGGVSPEGGLVTYIDWTAGNLALFEVETGASRLLTANASWKDISGWAEASTVAPDARRVAYSWYNERGVDFYELRIVGIDGSDPRVVYRDPATYWIHPHAWSPDGARILAYFSDAARTLVDERTGDRYRAGHLVLVSVEDGSVQRLRTWREKSFPATASFSPDGRFVAFDFAQGDGGSSRHDIFFIGLDSGEETRVVSHPADDRLMGWSSDGSRLLFVSDRTSRRALWALEITDGKPADEPAVVRAGFDGLPIGFDANGNFYFGVPASTNDVRLTKLDAMGTGVAEGPVPVSPGFVGATSRSDWARDGSKLVYGVGAGSGPWAFAIYSPATGEERIIDPQPPFRPDSRMAGPRLSPDGTQLLVAGDGSEEGYGIYVVNVATGAARRIVRVDPAEGLNQLAWSPDGRWCYRRVRSTVVRIDVASGTEQELHRAERGAWGLDVSPDGEALAFWNGASLVLLPASGGKAREIVQLEDSEQNPGGDIFVAWTADGEHVLFPKRGSELWRVRIRTGEQERVALPVRGQIVDVAVHPDGRQIAFTERQESTHLWVLQNLPSSWEDE